MKTRPNPKSADIDIDFLRERISIPCGPHIYTDEELTEHVVKLAREAAREAYQKVKQSSAERAGEAAV